MTEQGNFFRFDHQEDGFQDNRHSHVYPNFTAENLKYMIPDKAVVTKLEAIAGGTRKQRETAQKELKLVPCLITASLLPFEAYSAPFGIYQTLNGNSPSILA